jgi:hypothetical protein
MKAQTTTSLVILGERHFDHGYSCGRLWYFNAGILTNCISMGLGQEALFHIFVEMPQKSKQE